MTVYPAKKVRGFAAGNQAGNLIENLEGGDRHKNAYIQVA